MDLGIKSKTEGAGGDYSATELSTSVPVCNLSFSDEDNATASIAYNNIRVYAAADKFAIDPLKKLASGRFQRWVWLNYHHKPFPNIVREVLESVPANDTDMRPILVRCFIQHAGTMAKWTEMRSVLEDYKDLACAVLDGLIKKLETLTEEVRVLDEMIEESDYGKLRMDINSPKRCQGCDVWFNLRVDGNKYGWCSLRCHRCDARQV